MTTSPLPERAGRRCHTMLNVLHSTHYFSPDLERELAAVGVEDSRAAYFAVRAAAMGPVSAAVVTATFFNFRPELVARHVPAVWETAAPAVVLAARARAGRPPGADARGGRDAAAAAGRGGDGRRGGGRGGGTGAACRPGVHARRAAAVRGARPAAGARGTAPGALARGDPAARAPRRRPPRRSPRGGAGPDGGPGQPHRDRQGHGAAVGARHPRLAARRLGRGGPAA